MLKKCLTLILLPLIGFASGMEEQPEHNRDTAKNPQVHIYYNGKANRNRDFVVQYSFSS